MAELIVNNLQKSFDEKMIIKKLSFTIHEGEFVSVIGPSGSGKSTLFHLIGGLYQPDCGNILLNDQNITGKRGHISYMPQSPSLFPWRTILDNVQLGQEISGKQDQSAAKAMVKTAGLEGYENAYPSQLSGGMKQRASFIRCLLSPQPLMCLDEPFSALDELTRLEMQKWLLSIWEHHKHSVLFVTHNIEEALYLSDRILVLSTSPAEIKKIYTIPFERPREQSLMLSQEFLEWKREIYQELR
ncbi:ABC transporter ATP-binding protein [Halobacillus salinarum]|uniref:ABC transporter ATP-binding protein n=1 Tax=Halobacillus salinarum TaxID=2932257 RepID=A0ABY4EHK3_9BACI|nr:ABC transporter ATP-binding protein [Halobacillus salinarum]UOQ43945.1 ABC transporter ATP-binding protein [Halobacillus salinarum]